MPNVVEVTLAYRESGAWLADQSPPGGFEGALPAADRWRLALDAGGIGVWEWDLATDRTWWSPRVVELSGIPLPGTIEALMELVHPDDRAMVRAGLEDARHGAQPHQIEFRLEGVGGAPLWVEARTAVATDSRGTPRALVGTFVDVTERKETERAREHMLHEEQRLRSEAEAARERLQFLTSAGREVRSVLDPKVVRRAAVDLVTRHLGEWGLILDPAGRVVEAGAGGAFPAATYEPGSLRLAAPHEAVDQVVATGDGQMAALPAAIALQRDGGPSVVLGASSIMVVPLVLGSTRVGILVAGHRRTGRPYQADDLELFGQFAETVAATVVKATLFEERSAIARTLQQSLLPASLPDVDGVDIGTAYVPVGEGLVVGGDFYDVFRVSDGRHAFAIGDVSGKGSEAAAVTALVRHSIRAYAETYDDPSDVLVAVNEAIRAHGPSQRYCTAVFGLITGGSSVESTLAIGGHPLPLLRGADGEVRTAGTPGTLLGMFPDVTVATRTVPIEPGGSLVLYTDGVVEARRDGVPFGEQRLRRLVEGTVGDGPQAIADTVASNVAEYRDRQTDDLAVLVLGRRG